MSSEVEEEDSGHGMNLTWTFKLECSDRRLGDIMGEQKEIPTKWVCEID